MMDPTPQNIPHWYNPKSPPVSIESGDGAVVYDEDGTEYLDFISQLYCVNAGHGNATIIGRMHEQLEQIQYVASAKRSSVRAELAARIADVAPESLTSLLFSVSGSEANEMACQLARAYQDAPKVLTRWQSYHGATYAAGALTGDPETRTTIERYASTTGHAKFLPPLDSISGFESDSDAELAQKAADHLEFVIQNEGSDSVAAVLMEPIAGTSGAYTAPADYFSRVREICDRYNVLLIADEVITGFGRCGDWFGIQTEGVEPDMITFAKASTSAYAPLGGVIVSTEIADHLQSTGLKVGQTFGGHPVSCAAGLGAMDVYENGLLANVQELAPYLADRLSELKDSHEVVADIRGRGFHWAVTIADPETGEPFVHPWVEKDAENPVSTLRDRAQDAGVLLGSGRPDTQIILSPPLMIDRAQLDRGIEVLDDALGAVFQ